jgi:autotransporter adhesin
MGGNYVDGAYAFGNDAIAFGAASSALGNNSTAMGNYASAKSDNSTAFGTGAIASGNSSLALGANSSANVDNSVALGRGSVASNASNVSSANLRGVTRTFAGAASVGVVSIGADANNTRQLQNVSAGQVSTASTDAVNGSQLYAAFDAINDLDIRAANNPVRYSNAATPTTPASTDNSVVTNDVTLTGATASPVKLHNVADGTVAAGSTDAVNGGQLNTTNGNVTAVDNRVTTVDGRVTNLNNSVVNGTIGLVQQVGGAPGGGKLTVGAATGGAEVDIAGTGGARKLTNVFDGTVASGSKDAVNGGQLFDVDQRGITTTNIVNNIMNGGGIKYFHANSVLADSSATGVNSTAIGPDSKAGGINAISIGPVAVASNTNSIAIGNASVVSGDNSGALGVPNFVSGDGSYAIGNNNIVPTNKTIVVGNNVNTTGSGDGNVVLGDASTIAAATGAAYATAAAAPASQVSVGAAGAERRITNVAGGSAATDAVNVSQLNQVAQNTVTALGGGSAYNAANGAYTPPSYVVGAGTYNNVGEALGAENTIVNKMGNSVANTFGGTTTYDPATGTVAGSKFVVNGTSYGDVTNAFGAVNAAITGGGIKYFHANSALADSVATGIDSVAIGPNAVAANAGDIALGSGSKTDTTKATASALIGDQTYNFAGATPVSTISVGALGAERTITNVAAGRLSATSTDAVNGSQLDATNQQVGANTTNITKITNGTLGPVQRTGVNQLGLIASGGTNTAPGVPQTLTNVAAGALTTTSTEAVNGAQLTATNQTITNIVNGQSGPFRSDNTANVAAPTATGANATAGGFGATAGGARSTVIGNSATDSGIGNSTVLGNGASITAGVTGSNVALGQGSVVAAAPFATTGVVIGTTPYNFAGTAPVGSVSVGSLGAERAITNVAAGRLTATSTDAVNGSQLFATNKQVTDNTTNITNLTTNVTNGSVGTVQRGGTVNDLVLTAPGGTGAAPGAAQTLSNVAAGSLAGTSTQGVNGSQINKLGTSIANNFGGNSTFDPVTGAVTSPTFTVNGGTYNNAGSAFEAIDKSISGGAGIKYFHANSTLADSKASGTDSVAIGPVAVASAPNAVAMGANASATKANSVAMGANSVADRGALTGYTAFGLTAVQNSVGDVSVGSATALRQLTNVAAGTEVTDAVNVGQLKGAVNGLGASVTNVLGGTYDNSTGAYTGPTYNTYGGSTSKTIQDAFNTYNSALTKVENGGVGPVQYSNVATPTVPNGGQPTNDVTLVGADKNAPVGLHNVAAGATTANSTDAINGGQLNKVSTSVANNFGGGSTYDPVTGTVTAPTYNLQGGSYNNVGSALGALDTATTNNTTAITNINNGTSGIVRQEGGTPGAGTITVGKETGGTKVDITNNAGDSRVLTGVANGALAAGSKDAVNGGQLFETNEKISTISNGGGIKYFHANSTGADSNAVGTDSIAVGPTAVSKGTGSVAVGSGAMTDANRATAVGQGAQATAAGSVALGAGSVADRGAETYRPVYFNNGAAFTSAGTVSVGSEGAERVISNVAPGVRDTDAANVGQVKGLASSVDRRLDSMERGSNRAIASTAALSFQPVQQHPGQFVMSAGLGHYQGETALGVGGNYLFKSGRQKVYAGVASASGGKPVVQVGFSAAFGD